MEIKTSRNYGGNKNYLMKTYHFISIALYLSLFYSCKVESPLASESNGQKHEIVLKTAIQQIESKVSFQQADLQLLAEDSIKVWIDELTPNALPIYENCKLTSDGNGNLSSVKTLYYPQSNNIEIYALHTNAALASDEYPSYPILHSVASKQQELKEYVWSDLLYTKRIAQNSTSEIMLYFYHLLSKLQVAIVLGDGLSKADIEYVYIGGTKLSAELDVSKSNPVNNITVTPRGKETPIVIGSDISEDFNSPQYNDAIIVPQTVGKGTSFIVIMLKDGNRLTYSLPEDRTFESRYRYQFHITATRTSMTVATQISDWLEGGTVAGNTDIGI